LYVLNVAEDQLGEGDKLPEELKKLEPVLISAKIESELAELSVDELEEYLKELGISSTGLDKLIKAAYKI